MKKISVNAAKIIIIVIVLLAVILPNIIGTQTIITNQNNMVRFSTDLENLNYATVKDSEFEDVILYLYPNSSTSYASSLEEACQLVSDNKADAVVCLEEQIMDFSKNYDLAIFPIELGIPGYYEKSYYALLNKNIVGFNITSKTLEDINASPFEASFLSGVDLSDFVKTSRISNVQLRSFDTFIDSFNAANASKYPATILFYDQFDVLQESYENLAIIPGMAIELFESFAFQKNEEGKVLIDQFDEFLINYKESGEFNDLISKWTVGNDYVIPEYNYTGENGTLSICTLGAWEPMYFYIGNTLTGRLIELTQEFCYRYGYIPEFHVVSSFASELSGLSSGQYDVLCDCVPINSSSKETLYLAEPIYTGSLYLAVQKDEITNTLDNVQTVSKASIWFNELIDNFKINFIDENRYEMILNGLKTTLYLSLLSGVMGTILGAIICYLKMSKNSFAIAFSSLYIKIIQGIPPVLLLLVLYYVIFAGSTIDAFWVCALGFSLDFSAYVSEIFRTNILAIPSGQTKAALALGFSPMEAFLKVVLPQAMLNIIPVYSGQFIAMVKMTSIAGYIAVMDLTKMADIIRARTYQAFFPLIITAVLYFLISNLLVVGLSFLERKLDPKKRNRNIEGVVEK